MVTHTYNLLHYVIYIISGEYIVTGDLPAGDRFDLLEEALQLVDLDDANPDLQVFIIII